MEMVWIHIISIEEGRFTPTPRERGVGTLASPWERGVGTLASPRGCVSTKYPYGLAHVSPCPRSDELYTDIRRQQCAHMDQCSHDEHGELFVARGIDDFYDDPCGQQLPAEHPSVRGVSGKHPYDEHTWRRCGIGRIPNGYSWCGICVVDSGASGSVGAGSEPSPFYH